MFNSPQVPPMTLRNLAHALYLPTRQPPLSVAICRQMDAALKNLTRFLGRTPTIGDLDDDMLVRFVRWMRTDRHRTPKTTDAYLNRILVLWRYAAKREMIENWPEVKTLRDMRLVQWDCAKLATLYRNLNALQRKNGNVPERLFWIAVVAVAWDVHEPFAVVCRLRWDDVNVWSGWTEFPPATRKKHGRKPASFRVKLDRTTCEILRQLKEHSPPDEPLIFGQRLSHCALYHRFNRFLREWGLPSGEHNGISALRKSSGLAGSFMEAVQAGSEGTHV